MSGSKGRAWSARNRGVLGARRTDDGAAAIEFAIIMPILMILVFGVISFGYMLSFRQAVSQGAAEGARAAAVAPSSTSTGDRQTTARGAINDALRSYGVECKDDGTLVHSGGPSGTCTVEVKDSCTAGPSGARCAKVTLNYPYRSNSLLPGLGLNMFMPSELAYTTEVRIS